MKSYPVLLASIALVFSLCSSVHAIPATDVRFEDLMAQADDVKKSLNLDRNQQLLWEQVESKMRAILRERQRRREQLQADMKKGLADPAAELRDLAKKMDAEADSSYRENKQLRELWLTVNDALDDAQRRTILLLLTDHLQRIADQGCESKSAEPSRGRSMGRQKAAGAPSQY